MAWLAGWPYRKSITLSRPSGAVSNYQMRLLVGESAGAVGEDVDCGGKCRTDFADLRFTTSDEVTTIPYWIESISGTTPNQLATVWIKFPTIGTTPTTFYMYYGKQDASPQYNTPKAAGEATFDFFDDFNDGSIDTNKWNVTGTVSESGGIVTCGGTSNAFSRLLSKSTFGEGYIAESYAWIESTSLSYHGTTFFEFPSVVDMWESQAKTNFRYNYGSYYTPLDEAYRNAWYRFMVRRKGGGSADLFINGVSKASTSSNVDTGAKSVGFWVYDANKYVKGDWIFVRKYLAVEPAWGTWGDERFRPSSQGIIIA